MKYKILFFSHLFLFFIGISTPFAQLPNSSFYSNYKDYPYDSGSVDLKIDVLGFNKNNEYFNRIADGYTLFGNQINATALFSVRKNMQLEGGLYLRDDFGASGVQDIQPVFTLRTHYMGAELNFGAIRGSVDHRLIEPLYNFEHYLTDRIENGIQFRKASKNEFFDLWLEWETMIYRGENKQEEVIGGLSWAKQWGDHFSFPLQVVVYHKGGQIDSSPNPLTTVLNATLGVSRMDSLGRFKLENSAYFVFHKDFSRSGVLEYDFGSGLYFNTMLRMPKDLNLMLSYWKGSTYNSVYGGFLYESISSTFKYPDYREPDRQLIILRLMHDLSLAKGIVLSTRIEPHINLNTGQFEFYNAIYLRFNDIYSLFKK